ncbi:MAG: hypothetical protein BWY74_00664 [Firmicutes bacterium ADurb.Bin419]|nr:MAG: hypothetical protein BWY74_00664 [Firmicutes bacterium ADurb.Bin419]
MDKYLKRDSTNITIAEFYEKHLLGKYNYNPAYQRKSDVWNTDKKSFLIDSILKNFPIPPIFLHQRIDEKSGATKYDVIDGKQRLTAIVEFISNKIGLPDYFGNDAFGDELLNGIKFAELDKYPDYKKQLWRYVISIEYIDTDKPEIIDNVFDRLNRNGEPLRKQELRKAKYHDTVLLKLIDELSNLPYWKKLLANLEIHRMEDQEFVSELLFVLLEGEIFDSSATVLDELYSKWSRELKNDAYINNEKALFIQITEFLEKLGLDYEKYKISGVSHLYGLWCFAEYCVRNNISINDVKGLVHSMYESLRKREYSNSAIDEYRLSMKYTTKSKSQRRRRLSAMLEYCQINTEQ